MAAWLAEIKSRLLLPKAPELEDEGGGKTLASPSFVACRSTSATSWGRSGSMPCRGWAGDLRRRRHGAGFWCLEAIGARCFSG